MKITKDQLSFRLAIYTAICMSPMLFAAAFGYNSLVVPFGQGGIFNCIKPLAPTTYGRILSMVFMITPGLGLYLIGGNVAQYFWPAVIISFLIGLSCTLLTGYRNLGMVAISGFIPIFTAGLNAGTPEKAATGFAGFVFICLFTGLVSLIPYFKSKNVPKPKKVAEADRILMGIRMALGEALATGLSIVFSFGKLGWAPSAVGSVVRADITDSKNGAKMRSFAVVAGAAMGGLALYFVQDNLLAAMAVAFIMAVINGLLADTNFGRLPLFYNAIILILYSQTGSTPSKELVDMRIFYNLIGVGIALAVVYYPLPYFTKRVRDMIASQVTADKHI